MKLIISILLMTSVAFGDAVIFSGNDVKTLKQNIDLFGVAKILSGSVNPSAGAGVAAPQGSIYLSTTVGLYEKTGALATQWTKYQLKPVNLATDVTGILGVANGGSGLNGATAPNGSLLIGNSTGYSLATLTGTANRVTVTNGAGTITLSGPQDIATSSSPTFSSLTLTNPLTLANGGTSKALTAVAGGIVWTDADSMEVSAAGTSGYLLQSNGTSAPSWSSLPSLLDTTYFKQGGNSFSAAARLGTNDSNVLEFETNNTLVGTFSTGGLLAIGTAAPTTSAKLDIQGTNGALLLPRLTTAQKTALTATAGMEVYDTDLARMECYDGAWRACSSELTTKGDLATYSTTDTRLPVGSNGQVLTADSSTATGLLWANNTAAPDSSEDLLNLGIATSVAGNALTITLTDKAGATPSAGSPVKIAFRNATVTTGNYTVASATSATTMTVSSGSTLGMISGNQSFIYIYAMNVSGTIELAVSRGQYIDEGVLNNSSAEGGAGGADFSNAMYSTTARSSVPFRLIGRISILETTAGTWATNASVISIMPFKHESIVSYSSQQLRQERALITGGTTMSNCTTNPCSIVNPTTGGWISTARSSTGVYLSSFLDPYIDNTYICMYTVINYSTNPVICFNSARTTSTFSISCVTSGGTPTDAALAIDCLGPQ